MRPGPSPFVLFRARQATQIWSRASRGLHLREYEIPPPPLSERLKPILPVLFWWTVITSLAVHHMQLRIRSAEELGVENAKVSVLEALIERVRKGEVLGNDDVQRELEMVGLRRRTSLTDKDEERLAQSSNVSWSEALFGRRKQRSAADEEKDAVESWAQIVGEATGDEPAPSSAPSVSTPSSASSSSDKRGTAKRAPSSTVYL